MDEDPFVFVMSWNDLSKEESFQLYNELLMRTRQLEEKMSIMEQQFKKNIRMQYISHLKQLEYEKDRILDTIKCEQEEIQDENEERISELEETLGHMDKQNDDLTDEIDELKTEQEQLHDEIDELKTEQEQLHNEIDELKRKLDTSNSIQYELAYKVAVLKDNLVLEKSTTQTLRTRIKETLDTKESHISIQHRHQYILWWLSSNPLILDKIRTNEYIMGMLRENQHIMDLICKKQSLNELQTAISKYPHIR